jgi:FG-GAP repeat/IPT/TIG domain
MPRRGRLLICLSCVVVTTASVTFAVGAPSALASTHPLTSWTETDQFSEPGPNSFGQSVAISADGTTAVVGDPSVTDGQNQDAGVAYIFTGANGTWSEVAELTPPDPAYGINFGGSVSISSNGSTILVGAAGQSQPGQPECASGEAYVYDKTGNTWSESAGLYIPPSENMGNDCTNGFGSSLSLSSAGTTALIGAYYSDEDNVTASGAAYIFTGSGSSWSQQATMTASDIGTGDCFGISVALAADGTTAIIGANGEATDSFPGAAYIFSGSGSSWTQKKELTVTSESTNEEFGSSVGISAAGTTAAVGAAVEGNDGDGAAYVFTVSGSTWSNAQLIEPSPTGTDEFGWAFAFNSSGSTVFVGTPQYVDRADGVTNVGAVFAYTGSGTSWAEEAIFSSNEAQGVDNDGAGGLGISVSSTSDGSTVLASSPDGWGDKSTNGFVFSFSSGGTPGPTVSGFTPTSGPVGTTVTITGTNLSDASAVTFDGVAGTIKKDTATKIKVKVPTTATTGKIKVTTSGGSVTAKGKFTVTK